MCIHIYIYIHTLLPIAYGLLLITSASMAFDRREGAYSSSSKIKYQIMKKSIHERTLLKSKILLIVYLSINVLTKELKCSQDRYAAFSSRN